MAQAKGRPMLSWVGKRPLREVRSFPAQLVERFAPTTPDGVVAGDVDWTDWPERFDRGGLLFHGDNKEVLAHLLANGFRGKVDLVYIDPPFDSGADYVRKVQLRGASGSARLDGTEYTLGEQIQYTDIWANDAYLQFMYERLLLLRELLSHTGTLYLHSDSHRGHQLRMLLDEVFGSDHFRNEIVWHFENKLGTGGETFDGRHDLLLVYTPDREWTHNAIRVDVKVQKMQPVTQKINGKRVWLRDDDGKRLYQPSQETRSLGDVWTIPIINPVASERLDFPTQKPETLLERIVFASSNPGDIVLDCFVGSGTAAAVAQKLGRRWIGADINKGAIQTTEKRLAAIVEEQIAAGGGEQLTIETDEEAPPKPAQTSFTVLRVNDYDLQIQHNEAVELAVEHMGISRTRADGFFTGTLGKELAYVVSFDHPTTVLDLQAVARELEARPGVESDVVVVGLGLELSTQAWLEDHNRHRPINKIRLIDLRTDPKHGRFFEHLPATARVSFERADGRIRVRIDDFLSPSILERLSGEQGILAAMPDDWRSMVDSVAIDTAYDGEVFDVELIDIPARRSDLVDGSYDLEAPSIGTDRPAAVRITDMLGEEVLLVEDRP